MKYIEHAFKTMLSVGSMSLIFYAVIKLIIFMINYEVV